MAIMPTATSPIAIHPRATRVFPVAGFTPRLIATSGTPNNVIGDRYSNPVQDDGVNGPFDPREQGHVRSPR